jgi:uncharacterized protein (TIGR02391 family)
MAVIKSFQESHLKEIFKAVADAATHSELTDLFRQCGITECGGKPKWERMLLALSARQAQDRCGNNVANFIQVLMDTARFVSNPDWYSEIRNSVNQLLAFSGYHLQEDGRFTTVTQAKTITEAEERAGRLRANLGQRRVHPEVLAFCKAELVDKNYFHAVFEATKSVAQKIRDRTDLTTDGAELVEKAFSGRYPLLAINSLQTETEQSEQRGFANLLKGMFGTFRNVTAHAPKIMWSVTEQDALDLLTLVSFLHRRIDTSVRTPWTP